MGRSSHKDIQTSFAGGEFDPALQGRTDFAKFTSGCKTATNFFVSPHGTLMNRAGTEMIAALEGYDDARLVPFTFSDTDALFFVFTDYKFFVYKYDAGSVERVNLSDYSPYPEAAIQEIRFCQLGNTITMVHPDYPPYELRRISTDNKYWRLDPIDFDVPEWDEYRYRGDISAWSSCAEAEPSIRLPDVAPDDDHPARPWTWGVTRIFQNSDGDVWESKLKIVSKTRWRRGAVWDENESYINNSAVPVLEGAPHIVSIPEQPNYLYSNAGKLPSGPAFNGAQRPDVDGSTDYWERVTPSLYSSVVWGDVVLGIDEEVVVYADLPRTLDWTALPPEQVTNGGIAEVIGYRVYRGREGRYGLLGEVTGTTFVDEGATPDFANPPPQGTHPFEVFDTDGALERTEYPRTVCYYEGRRVFGGTDERPSTVWMSAVEQYTNFDDITLAKDSDALTFELGASQFESIRGLVPAERLVVMTDLGEWEITGGGQGNVITPSSIARRAISRFGSGLLEPLAVDQATLFLQRKGTVPRMMIPNENGLMRGFDISILSRSFFSGKGIVSWAFQEDPYPLIWVVRSDGVLLSCAYNATHELIAWTEHSLPGATVLSVCATPEGYLDSVYLVVERDSGLFLERMASRLVDDVLDARFLDSHSWYDGRNTTSAIIAVLRDDAAEEAIERYDAVTCTIGESYTDTPADLVGKIVRVPTSNGYFDHIIGAFSATANGLHLFTGGEALGYISRADQVALVTVGAAYPETDWAIVRATIDGLDHLEGETVVALVDGNVHTGLVVAGGSVTFGSANVMGGTRAAVACVGLSYNSDFESLKMVPGRDRERVVKSALIETYGSRGGYVGQSLDDEDNLEEIPVRTSEHEYLPVPLLAEKTPVVIRASYDTEGALAFRQSAPLPVSIIAVVRNVEFGGE